MISTFKKKENNKFLKNNFLFQAGAILLLLIVIVLIFVNFKIYQRKKELVLRIKFYKNQIEELSGSIQRLKNEINNSDNIDYLEKIAYEQLGEQKPGERTVIFVAPQEKTKEVQTSEDYFWPAWLSGLWDWIKRKF